jgi:hypothetical protein
MTSNLNRSGKQRFWEKHITQWEVSGLSQVEYCRSNNISIKSFQYWKKKKGVKSSFDQLLARSGIGGHPDTPIMLRKFSAGNQVLSHRIRHAADSTVTPDHIWISYRTSGASISLNLDFFGCNQPNSLV